MTEENPGKKELRKVPSKSPREKTEEEEEVRLEKVRNNDQFHNLIELFIDHQSIL